MEAVSIVTAASYHALLIADYPAETLAKIVPLISQAKPELLSSGTYYAAVENDQMIAVGGWSKTRPGTNSLIEGLGHIRHVATHPAHLRKGAAGLIMRHSLEEAKAAGMTEMECLSTRTAEQFYAKCGFQRFLEKDVLIAGVPFPSIEMRLYF